MISKDKGGASRIRRLIARRGMVALFFWHPKFSRTQDFIDFPKKSLGNFGRARIILPVKNSSGDTAVGATDSEWLEWAISRCRDKNIGLQLEGRDYICSRTLDISGITFLRGEEETRLVFEGSRRNAMIVCDTTEISNLSIIARCKVHAIIEVTKGANGLKVRNVDVFNEGGHAYTGIYCSAPNVKNIHVGNCKFINCGILINEKAADFIGLKVEESVFSLLDSIGGGVSVNTPVGDGAREISCVRCKFYGALSAGRGLALADFANAHNVNIFDCTFSGGPSQQIHVEDRVSDFFVVGCKFARASKDSLHCLGFDRMTITKNEFIHCKTPVHLVSAPGVRRNCLIAENRFFDFDIALLLAVDTCAVAENEFSLGSVGISAWAHRLRIIGNNFQHCEQPWFFRKGSPSDFLAEGNVIN